MSEDATTPPPDDAAIPADASSGGSDDAENLPPVKPPSAAFIVQLFLVPAMIVLVVVGVWALFGRMASSDQDWKRLVEEIKQDNPHRRWRGAMALIQLLRADQERGDKGEQLTSNREVAEALAGMLDETLDAKGVNADELKKQEFLARGLRLLDVPDVVLPVLQKAMTTNTNDERYHDVRKNAVASVAVIVGRAADKDRAAKKELPGPNLGAVIDTPGLMDDLETVSKDREALMRQIGAYTLGLIPTPRSRERLEVLLGDSEDQKTRVNAAIGLARQKSTKGIDVFAAVFKEAAKETDRGGLAAEKKTARYFWLGIAAFVLLISAVWAAGTTIRSRRIIASLICLTSIVIISWGVYDLVQRPADSELQEEPGVGSAEFAKRRQEEHEKRFERLVVVQNSLKAVGELSDQWTDQQRSELVALIAPISEKHPESRIRIDAGKTLRSLREAAE